MDIKQLDKTYIAGTYARGDLAAVSGEGSVIFDESGRRYIDMGSGIAVNIFGVGDAGWKNAVVAQLDRIQHASNLYYTSPQALLAKELCERTGFKKVFFSNSGAEANECMIKAARKYANDKYAGKRNLIVTLRDSFHGRTVTTLSATGQDAFHKDFGPFTPGFMHIEAGDMAALEAIAARDDVAAIMIELIQGEGGVNVLKKEYVRTIARIAHENDIIFAIDEVQTGNGRTGALYCYMNYGVTPDIISTAKGLGGGLPIGATLFGEKTCGVLTAGTHGSTFGGNPICASGALSIISRIDDELMAQVNEKGDYIRAALSGCPGIEDISGMGLMLGIKTTKPAGEVLKACMEKGVIVLTAKTKVRLLPALNIPWPLLKEAVEVIKEVAK